MLTEREKAFAELALNPREQPTLEAVARAIALLEHEIPELIDIQNENAAAMPRGDVRADKFTDYEKAAVRAALTFLVHGVPARGHVNSPHSSDHKQLRGASRRATSERAERPS
jgi:hypothetical protein